MEVNISKLELYKYYSDWLITSWDSWLESIKVIDDDDDHHHPVIIAPMPDINNPAGQGNLPPPQFGINRAEVKSVL